MKRILLDTHVLLWWLSNDPRLGTNARGYIRDPANKVYVSAATNWEISIKRSLGKLTAPDNFDGIIAEKGFTKLSITHFHGDQAGALPPHHNDPFDRMLIAQAQSEGLEIITKDGFFPLYAVKLIDAQQ